MCLTVRVTFVKRWLRKTLFFKKALRKLARGNIKLLFLPPYSPDYNPIEKSWANMKHYLRDNLFKFHSVDEAIYDYFGFQII